MDLTIDAPDGTVLAAHWARPPSTGSMPGLVLCHDFPTPPRGSLASGLTFPELADRIASQVGWRVLTFNFRGLDFKHTSRVGSGCDCHRVVGRQVVVDHCRLIPRHEADAQCQ